jgi:hypothetical protein
LIPQKFKREYYEQLFARKLANLEGIDKFIKTSKTESWKNRASEQINNELGDWANSQNLPIKKSPGPKVNPFLTLPKKWKGRNTSKLTLQGQHYLVPMPERDCVRIENYWPISPKVDANILKK